MAVLKTITERDRTILAELLDHRVLTTHQIARMHFASPRRARRRLLKLYGLRVLDRFQTHSRTGSSPLHYLVGEVGLILVAWERGLEVKELRARRERTLRLAASPRLAHLVEVNDFFSLLVKACRGGEDQLVEWWSDTRCASHWRGLVRPDGLGALRSRRGIVRFFVEVDRGSEPLGKVGDKLASYQRVSGFEDVPGLLLFTFPSERREAEARKVLYEIGITVATSTRGRVHEDPLGPIWLQLRAGSRVRLLEIPAS
ncbi:MAG: replication-relaxation family protein [Actinomycetota bacterium]